MLEDSCAHVLCDSIGGAGHFVRAVRCSADNSMGVRFLVMAMHSCGSRGS